MVGEILTITTMFFTWPSRMYRAMDLTDRSSRLFGRVFSSKGAETSWPMAMSTSRAIMLIVVSALLTVKEIQMPIEMVLAQ